jgi:hypothetical protein
MTDITDEQRAAVEWLREQADPATWKLLSPTPAMARCILGALPSDLTNPQPVPPTEPGAYHDATERLITIDPRGVWRNVYGNAINPNICPAPFTRLVPEYSLVEARNIADVLAANGLPGTTPLSSVVKQILILLTGTDRD